MSDMSLGAVVLAQSRIVQSIVENNGEITPDVEAALIALEARTPASVDSYAMIMERLKRESIYWNDKAEFFERVALACNRAREKMRDNIKYILEKVGKDEIIGNDVRFKLVPVKSKLIINEDYLDPEYFKETITRVPDRKRIEEDLKAGKDVTGAMFAESKALREYANRGKESE